MRRLSNVFFLGAEGTEGLEIFWKQQEKQEWVIEHPGFKTYHVDFKHAIPLGVHADKGAHIKRDKLLNIAWGSCKSRAPTIWSKILFTVLPDELLVKGVTDEELYAVLVWSLHVLMVGEWPAADHHGVEWPYGSRRWAMQGKRLAGPFVGLFSEYRGDWEWSVDTFMWRISSRCCPIVYDTPKAIKTQHKIA